MRIDLHVHSRYSQKPSQWFLQKMECPESFTEPKAIYRRAKAKGMTHVTITDHNTIDGALEISNLPDTFISEEITSFFPQDGCKVHILAYHITPEQHAQFQEIRHDIYKLAAYLQRENIVHAVAHPLYGVNDKLNLDHFEQMLLLFRNFELNGSRSGHQNEFLQQIFRGLGPQDIQRLQQKHQITPAFARPWRKNILGGSDDHSGLNIARTHTCLEKADTVSAFLSAMEQGRTEVVSDPALPQTMAHNLYSIAFQFFKSKYRLERYAGKDVTVAFLDRVLDAKTKAEPNYVSKFYYYMQKQLLHREKLQGADSLVALLKKETRDLIAQNPRFWKLIQSTPPSSQETEKIWYDFANQTANRILFHYTERLVGNISGANIFKIFQTIGSAGDLYMLLAPYFVAYTHFTKDRTMNQEALRRFQKTFRHPLQGRKRLKVAHFTDTFFDVNGVAYTLQQQVQIASETNKQLKMITCHDQKQTEDAGVKIFKPVGVYALPEYHEQPIYCPPLLEMLEFCYREKFTHIHAATPGPIGLAALAIARMLKLPICSTYHTAIPQYAHILTGDDAIEKLAWKYIRWYYEQMDFIYAPSQSTKEELVQRGIPADSIKVYPRGVDVERFHPSHRNGYFGKNYQIQDKLKLLYVGRVSKEKNLHILAEAFKRLAQAQGKVYLVVVGDGPYYEEMREEMRGLPCIFTGYREGDELATIYASSDIFVFPSTTDTFGNVVLEAQASGLPVIVTDQGGPSENMLPNQTGLVVKGDSIQDLQSAVTALIENPHRIRQMSAAARAYMEQRSFHAAFKASWELYHQYDTPSPKVRAA
jgi:glycosyltransferase involved in cell wall biosynthesis/predicted metal-dependent phosphoesterase TrpH